MSAPGRCPNCAGRMLPNAPCPECGARGSGGKRALVIAGLALMLAAAGAIVALAVREQRAVENGIPVDLLDGAVTVSFPGRPTATYEAAFGKDGTTAYQLDDRATGLSFTAAARGSETLEYHYHDDEGLAAEALKPVVWAIRDAKFEKPTATISNGYKSAQAVLPIGDRVRVVRTVAGGRAIVALTVSGPGLDPADPRVVRFFDSVRVRDVPPPEPAARETHRPLAWIVPPFGAGFAPTRNAVYVREMSPSGFLGQADWPPNWKSNAKLPTGDLIDVSKWWGGVLARYHYPSFRREGVVKIEPSSGCVVNDAANQLYVLSGATERDGSEHLLVYDLGPPNAPPAEPKLLKRFALKSYEATPPVLAAGGRFACWLEWITHKTGRATAVRFDTKTLERTELVLEDHYRLMCVSPDGTRLGVASDVGGTSGGQKPVCAEIDPQTWRVRQSFPLASGAHSIVLTDDRRLMFVSFAGSVRHSGRLAVLNLNDAVPKEVYLDRPPTLSGLYLSADGTRLLASGRARAGYWGFTNWGPLVPDDCRAVVLDARAAAEGRWREQAVLRSSREDRIAVGDEAYLSPDGKCVLFHTGRAYWLAADDPLPAIDPAAAWKP